MADLRVEVAKHLPGGHDQSSHGRRLVDYTEVVRAIADDDELFNAIATYVASYPDIFDEEPELAARLVAHLRRIRPFTPYSTLYRGEPESPSESSSSYGRGFRSWTSARDVAEGFARDYWNGDFYGTVRERRGPVQGFSLVDLAGERMRLREGESHYGGLQSEWLILDDDLRKHQPGKHDQMSHGRRGTSYWTLSDPDEANEWAQRYRAWRRELTAEENQGLADYQGSAYLPANSLLRGHPYRFSETGPESEAHARTVIEQVDAALAKAPRLDQDRLMFRRVSREALDELETLGVGAEFTDPGFVSTSVLEQPAIDYASHVDRVAMIYVTAGAAGAYVGELRHPKLEKEYEYLLPRGTRFRILDLDYEFSKRPEHHITSGYRRVSDSHVVLEVLP